LEKFRVIVGSPEDAQLGAEMQVRRPQFLVTKYNDPDGWRRLRAPGIWLLGRCSRWPANQMRELAYRWFRTAARLGRPVSGGATWNALTEDLRNEISMSWWTTSVADWETFPVERELFNAFLQGDKEERTHDRIRRLYSVSLLGARFATPRNVQLLRAAGADVEEVKESLIVTTSPTLEQVWTPEYLAKTAALRKLAWPISIQNPIDYEGLGRAHWFRLNPRSSRPRYPTPDEIKAALAAFRAAVAARMPASVPDDALEFAPGSEAPPLAPIRQDDDFTEELGDAP
jgi:hypothetical protein